MITPVRRRWSALDNAIKQIVFFLGSLFALLLVAALVLGILTDQWSALGGLTVITGMTGLLFGLAWLAGRLFPTRKD